MLFSTTYTFAWDLGIMLLLGMSISMCAVCAIHLRRKRKGFFRRAGIAATGMLAALLFGTVAYGSFVEPQLIVVTAAGVSLPVRQPLKIVVLSDFHVGPYKDGVFVQRVVNRVNELVPDVVLLAGDYLLGETDIETAAAGLEPLSGLHSTFGTYAVLGNHDHGLYRTLLGLHQPAEDPGEAMADILSQLGVVVLQNQNVIIDFGTNKLAIAGVEDRWTAGSDVGKALAGIAPGIPIVLAAHNPDVILDERSKDASIIVAGHTHGGQIRLPGFGPLPQLPTRLGQVFDQGLFPVDENTVLAVTRGVGESGPRMRLFAQPEILLLQITPDKDSVPDTDTSSSAL